jgi:ABC-type nitrate/sulfonate/bicarbonate transport systems, periplasmic components
MMTSKKHASKKRDTRRRLPLLMVLGLVLALLAAACGSNNSAGKAPSGSNASSGGNSAGGTETSAGADANAPAETEEEEEKELVKITQITNWFAQAEHGGQYTALMKGFYEEAGLDMEIQSGGPGISATQIVASGRAQFGMGQGDEILFARQNGIPLVAIAGIFQKNPQALMFHKGEPIDSFDDLNGRKVYVGSGVAYWEYMKKKFNLTDVIELKYTGSLAEFVNDKTAVTQSYMTSEPFTMQQEGIEVDWLLNADSGYMPYGNLLFTTEQFIKEHPDIVRAYVEASIKGWNYYKDNYEEINPFIQEFNPDMPLEKLAYSAQAMQPLVYGFDAEEHGVGYMSHGRWETLMNQLLELDLLKEPIDVSTVFTNEFLPKE